MQAEKSKITVQLWNPLLTRLNELTASACINRDAYLDAVFANEVDNLFQELGGKCNSDCARAFIKKCFAELKDYRQVSFNLSASTAKALTGACKQANVWRDVFVNRVIYFLVVEPTVIARQFGIDLARYETPIFDEGREIRGLLLQSPLHGIQSFIKNDPFMAIRLVLNKNHNNGDSHTSTSSYASPCLHEQILGNPKADTLESRGLVGFNVYLEDGHVPGTPQNRDPEGFAKSLFSWNLTK